VRRCGAHGISHEYVADEAARLLGLSGPALEGLVMGTRGGDVDPGVLLHLMRHAGLDLDAIEDLLHHHAGLEGLAGVSDFRDLLASVDDGNGGARTAYDVYCHRLRKYVGAYYAVLGGVDAVVFTAGVGENTPRLRADALAGLDSLGIAVDPDRNEADNGGPRAISPDGARVAVLVVPTNEELSIARQAVRLLDPSSP
jgi:acetate kinase